MRARFLGPIASTLNDASRARTSSRIVSWWKYLSHNHYVIILYYTITLSYISYIMLYYIILHYIILHYIIILYYTIYYIILYYIILYYIILYYIILYYIILYYIILYYIISSFLKSQTSPFAQPTTSSADSSVHNEYDIQ